MPPPPTDPRIALYCQGTQAPAWHTGLCAALPSADIRLWPVAAEGARHAVVWSPTQAFMDAHPDLLLIFNMGAGVDAFAGLRLPPKARVVRIEDGGMAVQMADYVCHALLRFFREFDRYADRAAAADWAPRPARNRQDFPVGVMGLGALGERVARTVAAFDFPVLGWSRSPRQVDGVACHSGEAQFDEFLSRSRVLVCMLQIGRAHV